MRLTLRFTLRLALRFTLRLTLRFTLRLTLRLATFFLTLRLATFFLAAFFLAAFLRFLSMMLLALWVDDVMTLRFNIMLVFGFNRSDNIAHKSTDLHHRQQKNSHFFTVTTGSYEYVHHLTLYFA